MRLHRRWCSRRHAPVTSVGLSTIVPLPSKHRPLSTTLLSVYGGRQNQSVTEYKRSRQRQQLSAQQQTHITLVTLTSTTKNAAATASSSGVSRDLPCSHSLSCSHNSTSPQVGTLCAHSLFVSRHSTRRDAGMSIQPTADSTSRTVYSNEVPLLRRHFQLDLSWREETNTHISDKRCYLA